MKLLRRATSPSDRGEGRGGSLTRATVGLNTSTEPLEKVKVQRGRKSYKTTIAEGQRIHYSFVKPRQALDGRVPAEGADSVVDWDNKW